MCTCIYTHITDMQLYIYYLYFQLFHPLRQKMNDFHACFATHRTHYLHTSAPYLLSFVYFWCSCYCPCTCCTLCIWCKTNYWCKCNFGGLCERRSWPGAKHITYITCPCFVGILHCKGCHRPVVITSTSHRTATICLINIFHIYECDKAAFTVRILVP